MEKINVKNLVMSEIGASEKVSISEKVDFELPDKVHANQISGEVKLIRLEETILLQAKFVTEATFNCDRCLDNFNKKILFEFNREYEINRQKDSEENLVLDKYLNIDLTEPVREELILAIPIQNICSEECKGIIY